MNEERLENAKSRVFRDLPKLKSDIVRLNECVTIYENFLNEGTLDNWKDFEDKVDKISESMELLQL